MKIQVYNSINTVTTLEKKEIVDFLFHHLDEFGDKWEDIERAVDYALNPSPAFGGFILFIKELGKIKGAVVMNKTRMKGYIPENVLVYIAVHQEARGQGIGKELMRKAIQFAKTHEKVYSELASDHPIDLTRYQVANCLMGRAGLINSGGGSGENDLAQAVRTAVINKRAGGMGLISGRKAFQKPMNKGVELLNAIQDVYLDESISIA